VAEARAAQRERGCLNARLSGKALDRVTAPDIEGRNLMTKASEAMGLTARAYHRILKVARTIADLDGCDGVRRIHIAEALSARKSGSAGQQAVSRPATISTFP
jgi:magnesium chelatase family protein